jgi:hypothetical protein
VVLEYKDIFFLTNAPYAFIFVGWFQHIYPLKQSTYNANHPFLHSKTLHSPPPSVILCYVSFSEYNTISVPSSTNRLVFVIDFLTLCSPHYYREFQLSGPN